MACYRNSVLHLSTVDSTNRHIRDEADTLWNRFGGYNGFVVVTAENQTAGRGQRGNKWNSNAGENLLLSILVRPGESLAVAKQFALSQAVALALHDAMLCYGIDVRLKWPNDIYVGDKKICGILLESIIGENNDNCVIVGVGINVNQTTFNGEFNATPTSVILETGKSVSIKAFKKKVYKIIKTELKLYKKDKSDFIKTFNQNNYLSGKDVYANIDNKVVQVKCLNVNDNGTLKVIYNKEEKEVSSGEITFHL